MITALCRTVILYFLIMIGLRLMGKRQIGELEPSELVLTMMISDLATVPMQDFGIPLLAGVIPILILLSLTLLMSQLSLLNLRFRALMCGTPAILIRNGKLQQAAMRKNRYTLDELLEQRDLLRELIEDVYSVSGDTAALLRNLPEDLPPEREAVIRTACSLVGKVNYFWGGKSLVIGWDIRWGELRQVTAAGNSTTGTYRPYGLDCSGFVDRAFYNATGGSYIIGHGGGATMQHSYCADISWPDAQPGDLVFYPDNSHVGIICGRDEDGSLLVIHCASGANSVVITGTSGFISVARPDYFSDN